MTTAVLMVCWGGLTGLVWALGFFLGRTRSSEQLFCPKTGMLRGVTFDNRLDAAWDVGRPVDVLTCSAFEPCTDIRCEKTCTTRRMVPNFATLPLIVSKYMVPCPLPGSRGAPTGRAD
jgi:hypothetical protein